ncbi:hypothetical protein [Sphingomonas hylomeconis]|uniref:Uncharacterized protein n=1 Tax=Sphingomonas hylomeconis TaxID=1395958 RepID=A0ABV7SXH5_9SPHN|nr:hypothetical protein [Sphingomonas hylomeconis]
MMLAAMLIEGAVVLSAPVDPIAAFRAVCMEGGARFADGAAKSVKPGDISPKIRRVYRPPAEATLFAAKGAGGEVIIATENSVRQDGTKHCEVFAENLGEERLSDLGFRVGPPKASPAAIRNFNSAYDVTSDQGYILKAVKVGAGDMVIRSIALTPEQSERRQNDYRTISDPAVSKKERNAAARRIAEEGN